MLDVEEDERTRAPSPFGELPPYWSGHDLQDNRFSHLVGSETHASFLERQGFGSTICRFGGTSGVFLVLSGFVGTEMFWKY